MQTESTKPHIFSSDKPIVTSSEDLLNRAYFSQQLSKSLANWNESESLVVGLYGKWGDGKTSVKNMLVEELKKSKASEIEFFEFNPWQWSHKENLLDSFFSELIRTLSKSSESNAKELIEKLSDYLEYLKLADELVTKLRENLKAFFFVLSFGLALVSVSLDGRYSFITAFTAIFLFAFGQSLKVLNWVLSFYLKWKKLGSKEKSLEQKKNEISGLLKRYSKTFLVIVDDVDRLTPEEVKNLFTLIKANADFPKLVYLTMFQRDIVERSLRKSGVYSGREYLEKIIQVAIDLPDIPPEGIHQILFKKLDKVLNEFGGDKNFESGRWSELFTEGISVYFKNLRDVNRFISSLSFQMGALYKNDVLEVNSIDLIGIEVLRHFEPNVYKSLFDHKTLLTASYSSGIREYSKENDKKAVSELLDLSTPGNRDVVQHIIKVLFPNVQWTWSNSYSSVDEREFRKLRVCHPDRFNRYFSFFMSPQEFNQYEFEEVLACTNDTSKLIEILQRFHSQGRLTSFLEKFESYKQEVPAEHANSFLSAMFEIGDLVSDERRGFYQISPFTHLERIVLWYLKKKEFKDTRREVFKKAVEETNGISLPIMKLFDEYDRRRENKYPDSYSLNAEDKEWVKELLLAKIQKHKDKNEFKENIHLPRLLLIWKEFEQEEVKKWIAGHVAADDFLVRFCNLLMAKTFSSSGYETKINHYLPALYLKEFFEQPKEITARLRTLSSTYKQPQYEHLFMSLNRADDEIDNPEKYKDRFRDFDDE